MTERILIVSHEHPDLNPGGAGMASYLLFTGLQQQQGVEAYYLARTGEAARQRVGTPFSPHRGRPNEILFYTNEVDAFLFSQQSRNLIEQFAQLLAQIDPQVIHFHHYTAIGLELIAVARRYNPRIRIIVTLHEYLAICHHHGQMVKTGSFELCSASSPHDCAGCHKHIAPSEFLLRELFIKSHFNKVDLFIAPSEFLRRRYVAWGLPDWQIVLLENGVRAVEPPPPRPLGDGERRSVFGFFGQINPYKGLLQLLAAFEHLDRFPAHLSAGLRLVVNGAYQEGHDPTFPDAFSHLLAKTQARVHFAGPYKPAELYRLMAGVDWVVVPSIWWENSPMVIQEALAHRRPVLCSGIGGMAEKVRWGQDGFHFPVGNTLELARLLVHVAADGAIWEGLQQTIRAPMPIGEAVARHLRLYRDDAFALAH
jgi:glycosyltransferase involved in cell wall biosynthesis